MNLNNHFARISLCGLVVIASAMAAAQTNPSLGAGLDGVIDWSRTNHFVDMVKQSRGFFSPSGGDVPKDASGMAYPRLRPYFAEHRPW